MNSDPRPDLYVSADVETDGPLPGPFSMLSFGLAAVGVYDGRRFEQWPLGEQSFYRELRPISEEFDSEALAVNGLDRAELVHSGADPTAAMTEAADWLAAISSDFRPVLVAYPVAFDWSFLYWYFENFTGSSPFGHSSCLDIRTLYLGVTGFVFDLSAKDEMPGFLMPESPHTHNALDDAIEQGELFANLLQWVIRRRNQQAHSRADAELPSWLLRRVHPIS